MNGASESSGMNGSVGQGAPGWGFASGRVSDLIRTLCDEAVRRGVRIVAAEKRGHIFFDQGHVVHAEFGEDVGLGAVVEMLHAGMVEFRPCARPWPSQPSLFFTADKLLAATRPGAVHLLTTGVRRKWDASSAARGFSEPPPLPELEEPVPPPASTAAPRSSAPASAPSAARSTPAAAREKELPDDEQADLTARLVRPGEAASTLGAASSDLSRAVAAAVSRSTQGRSAEPPPSQRPSSRTERNWLEPSAPVPSAPVPSANGLAAGTAAPRVLSAGVVTARVVAVAPAAVAGVPAVVTAAAAGVAPALAGAKVAAPGAAVAPAATALAAGPLAPSAVASKPPPSSRPSTEAPSDAAGAELVERERSAPPPRPRPSAELVERERSAPPPRPRPSTVWVERAARREAPSPLEVASSGATSSRRFRRILPGVTPPPTSMVRVSARGVILAARGDASEQLASAAAFIHNQAKLIAADLGRHGRTAVHLRGGGLSLLVVKSEVNDIAAALGPTGRLRSLLRKVGLG